MFLLNGFEGVQDLSWMFLNGFSKLHRIKPAFFSLHYFAKLRGEEEKKNLRKSIGSFAYLLLIHWVKLNPQNCILGLAWKLKKVQGQCKCKSLFVEGVFFWMQHQCDISGRHYQKKKKSLDSVCSWIYLTHIEVQWSFFFSPSNTMFLYCWTDGSQPKSGSKSCLRKCGCCAIDVLPETS